MALFYLVRHGETNYKHMFGNGFEIIECTYQKGQAECEYSFT